MRTPTSDEQRSPELLLLFAEEWIVEPLQRMIIAEAKKLESRFVHLRPGVKADMEEMQKEIRERLEGIESSLEIIAREMARKAGSERKGADGTVA
jgi:tetrahydromethanopterin S-methyltransferase subunit G